MNIYLHICILPYNHNICIYVYIYSHAFKYIEATGRLSEHSSSTATEISCVSCGFERWALQNQVILQVSLYTTYVEDFFAAVEKKTYFIWWKSSSNRALFSSSPMKTKFARVWHFSTMHLQFHNGVYVTDPNGRGCIKFKTEIYKFINSTCLYCACLVG